MENRFEIFATTVASINRIVQKIKTNVMHEYGLKGTHGMCLYMLGKNPTALTSAQLCQLIKEDKAAVSRAINELQEQGYLVIEEQDHSKRAYRSKLNLTEKGNILIDEIQKNIDEVLDYVGKDLNEQERIIFYRSLSSIANNLETYLEKGESK